MLKISIFTLLCVFGTQAYAQIPASVDGVTIDTNISNPRPEQMVEVFVESFGLDLNASSIVWLVDGKNQGQGIGLKKILVTMPRVGVTLNVKAVIKTPEGKEIQKSLVLKSGSVDIIWEPRGYTPPFFEGKLPLVYQNSVRIVAIPHLSKDGLSEIDPKTLVYQWKMGGKYVPDGQGYGKQSVNIQLDSIPKPLEIEVEVYTREQSQNTSGSISIEPIEPFLYFYEDNSLYGILFNKILTGRVSLKNEEMRVRAVPFGFNIGQGSDANVYNWSVNNVDQPSLLKNQSITIRTKAETEGISNINLDIRNQEAILQGARGQFTVYFSKKQPEEEGSGTIF
ncbi:MAG: hypothetical protein QG640_47 [Patescibacteria group bacterium]|nr:hypothetical protein [Patescibacteria group bacterium]